MSMMKLCVIKDCPWITKIIFQTNDEQDVSSAVEVMEISAPRTKALCQVVSLQGAGGGEGTSEG